MQIKQIIFEYTDMQVLYFFSRPNSKTWDIWHTIFPLPVAELSTLKKNNVFFGPLCIYMNPENLIDHSRDVAMESSFQAQLANIACRP